MRSPAPAVMPIFRSSLQALLLLRVLTDEQRHTAAGLARLLHAPEPTVHRELRRLVDSGLLTSSPVGRANVLMAADDNPATGPLRQLLIVTYGPVRYLEQALAPVEGIQEAYVYGSWAARWHGELGPAPGDVDTLVVGAPDRDDVYDALDGIESALGREVNIRFVSPERWATGQDAFLTTVHSRPLVPLQLSDRAATVR